MRKVLVLLALVAAVAVAGSFRLENPVFVGGTDELLQYDDGSAYWLTWGGLYRGTWFDVTDFDPTATGAVLQNTQYWFYHHSSYPWDTASFYAELWNGDEGGPVTQLNQTSKTATHYSAVTVAYSPNIEVEADFWALVNTSMSSGGWPAVLGDNSAQNPSHSFYSDDFIIWEPWIVGGATANDYLIRANGTLGALDTESWGAIKGLYR